MPENLQSFSLSKSTFQKINNKRQKKKPHGYSSFISANLVFLLKKEQAKYSKNETKKEKKG